MGRKFEVAIHLFTETMKPLLLLSFYVQYLSAAKFQWFNKKGVQFDHTMCGIIIVLQL